MRRTKNKIFLGLLLGFLLTIIIVGAIFSCVPAVQNSLANYLVNKSSIHKKTLEENESLKNQNDEQSNQIALLNMALNEKDYKISLLNSSLETGKQEKLELEQQLDLSLKKQQSLQEEILLKEQKISELSSLNEELKSQLKLKQETNDNLSNEIEKKIKFTNFYAKK